MEREKVVHGLVVGGSALLFVAAVVGFAWAMLAPLFDFLIAGITFK